LLRVEGRVPLEGKVTISGSKNSILPCMAVSLLTSESLTLNNIPIIDDMKMMVTILKDMDISVIFAPKRHRLFLRGTESIKEIPDRFASQIRGSILLLGGLLARKGYAKLSQIGGCQIGKRSIDFHLKAFRSLGAKIIENRDSIEIIAKKMRGTDINFPFPSVGATENTIIAATLAKGITKITNIAVEPEVLDLIKLLKSMGAIIDIDVSNQSVQIKGVKDLGGASHEIIPDRIEAGTYAVASAVTEGELLLDRVDENHLQILRKKLFEMNIETQSTDERSIKILKPERPIRGVEIETAPYPGFPTDLQPQFTVLGTKAEGMTQIHETIFEQRFHHVKELKKMGASISVNGQFFEIKGPTQLVGAKVEAMDLRGGAALIIAALSAKGITEISGIAHINRGYENIEQKLRKVGACIEQTNPI